MIKNNKVVIIDGTALIVDAYFNSMPEELAKAQTIEEKIEAFDALEKNCNGKYIGAVRGLFSVILDTVDRINPTHIAVVWGTSRKSNIRKEIYGGYKSDNSAMDEPLREQFKTAQALLAPLVKQFTSNKYEAIDLAGTLADKFKDKAQVTIVARNNNYLQLCDIADVCIKTPRAESLIEKYCLNSGEIPTGFFKYNKDTVKYVKDLEPSQILGYNALVGVPSSGVPGVKGVGAATALPIIKKYSTIDNLYNDIDNIEYNELQSMWKELGLRNNINKLANDRDNAFISRDLLKINKDVFVNNEDLEGIQNSLTFKSVARELNKVGLLIRMPVGVTVEDNSHIRFRDLLEDTDINSFDDTSIPFGAVQESGNIIGLRGEEEYIDTLDVEFMESEEDCYILKAVGNISVDDNSLDLDDCWDTINYDDDYYGDDSEDEDDYIDEGGEYCEFETVSQNYHNIDLNYEPSISLVETIVIKKYKCNVCGNVFTLQGDVNVKFCVCCGNPQSNNVEPRIDNLETTGCNLDDIKIKENLLFDLKR